MQPEKFVQAKSALLVIDVQQGLFTKSTPIYNAGQLLGNINLLVERAHRAGVPVYYIQHSDERNLVKNSQDWQLHSQIHPQQIDYIVHKCHGNAFEDTNLGELLRSLNITSLVITGLVTHGCVKATVIGARQLGYQVTLAADGHSSYSKDAAQLIDKWNLKLSELEVELIPTSEITFS